MVEYFMHSYIRKIGIMAKKINALRQQKSNKQKGKNSLSQMF